MQISSVWSSILQQVEFFTKDQTHPEQTNMNKHITTTKMIIQRGELLFKLFCELWKAWKWSALTRIYIVNT